FLKISAEILDDRNHLTELESLVKAILQNQAEAEVFKIAIELVQKLADKPSGNQRSERSGLTPTNGSFSIPRSISEASGFNKNVTSITAALLNELHKNVIVDLDNFWTKLFLDKEWSDQTLRIWESYEAYE
ncbi:Bgt-20166, partial [Blumeria graminis f. sp. tritici]